MESNWGNDRLIGSLAILKSGLISGKDFISTYIPFIARILLDYNSEIGIDIHQIMEGFGKEYGFSINRQAMTSLLNKCAREGLLVKRKNATYSVNVDKCEARAIKPSAVMAPNLKSGTVLL